MKLASPYLKGLLSAHWFSEQAPAAGSWMEVAVHNCNPDTLMLILRIIHGKTQEIPREISLGELAKFAIAVDYFQCVEAVELAAQMWLRMLKLHIPSYWTPEIPIWMMILSGAGLGRIPDPIPLRQGKRPGFQDWQLGTALPYTGPGSSHISWIF